jgi:hypothetical protein
MKNIKNRPDVFKDMLDDDINLSLQGDDGAQSLDGDDGEFNVSYFGDPYSFDWYSAEFHDVNWKRKRIAEL